VADKRLRAVVCDMDGVLVDTEHLWEEMWVRYCSSHGVTWTRQDTLSVQGMNLHEWSSYLSAKLGGELPAAAVAHGVVSGMHEALEDGRVEMLPGVRECLQELAERGVPLAVASSAPKALIQAILEHNGLARCFRAVTSSEEVPRGKPWPDVYLEAAARLGVAPEECVAVEDSNNGIRAAARAGLLVIALPNRQYPPDQAVLSLARYVADSFWQVKDLILQLLCAAPGSPTFSNQGGQA